MPHLVKTFHNDDNTPYHKDGVKSLLCKTPVLFNFHSFALTSIRWSASRTEGRIIGFGVFLVAYGGLQAQVILVFAVLYQFLIGICPLSQRPPPYI